MQDVDAVDLVELSDPVLELKQRGVVHRHLELVIRAQDLHLKHTTSTFTQLLTSEGSHCCEVNLSFQTQTVLVSWRGGRCQKRLRNREAVQAFIKRRYH